VTFKLSLYKGYITSTKPMGNNSLGTHQRVLA
jgi:hypothetical protein